MKNNAFPFQPRALVLALALATTCTANAANIIINTDCTLIAAINNANSDTDTDGVGFGCRAGNGADTLIFNAGTTYTLTKAALPWISSKITINGNGSTIMRSHVRGTPLFRLLSIAPPGDLTVNNLTLTGGYTSEGGGGIANSGSLILRNSSVSGNTVSDYNHSSPSNGGGIWNNGSISLENSTISGNFIASDWSPPWGSGGGIFNQGRMVLNKSTISSNASRKDGGITNSGEMEVNKSTVSDNTAFFQGSAGISNSGNLTLTNSSISNNSGYAYYSGLYYFVNSGINNSGNMTLSNSFVSNNEGSENIANSGKITLNNCTVKSNFHVDNSVVINSGSMALIDSHISRNIFYNFHNSKPIAGLENDGDLAIQGSAILHNEANGLRNNSNGIATLANSIISNNDGGIVNDGIIKLVNNLILNNKSGSGGGIFNQGRMTLRNTTLMGNNGIDFSGGGIANKGVLSISHSTISGNTAVDGGGIKNYLGAELTVSNSLIANSQTGGDCKNEGILNLVGNNLIEDGSCGATLSGDPKLAPLLNNGGLTSTFALLAGSPAINTADKSLCATTDQRKVKRPQLSSPDECDLGAFEQFEPVLMPGDMSVLWNFFNQESLNGGIKGTGKEASVSNLNALRNQLTTAVSYKLEDKTSAACVQLAQTLKYIDPDNTPDANDYVTGVSAGELANQIVDLRTVWQCK